MTKQLDLHKAEERPSDDDIGKLFWLFKDEKDIKHWFNNTPAIYDGDWINVWNNKRLKYDEYNLWTKIPSESYLFNPNSETFAIEEIRWYSPKRRLPALVNIDNDNKFFSNPVTAIIEIKTNKDGSMFYHYIFEYCSDGDWYIIDNNSIENRRKKFIIKNVEWVVVCWTEVTDVCRNMYRRVRRSEV